MADSNSDSQTKRARIHEDSTADDTAPPIPTVTIPTTAVECARKKFISGFVEDRRLGRNDSTRYLTIDEHWKNDREITRAALGAHVMHWNEIPPHCRNDKHFMMAAIAVNPKLWQVAPKDFSVSLAEMEHVLSVPHIAKSEFIEGLKHRWKEVTSYPPLWEKIAKEVEKQPRKETSSDESAEYVFLTLDKSELYKCLKNHAPTNVLANPSLMKIYVEADPACRALCPEPLFDSQEFVAHVLRSPYIYRPLELIPRNKQRRWPELVIESFEHLPTADDPDQDPTWREYLPLIDASLWQDANVRRGWFRAGCPFLLPFFQQWKDDPEIFKLIAENCAYPLRSFRHLDDTLKRSREYILELMKHNPLAIFGAHPDIRRDPPTYEMAVVAFAYKDKTKPLDLFNNQVRRLFIKSIHTSVEEATRYFQDIQHTLQSKLSLRATFMTGLLNDPACNLARLRKDNITTKAISNKIFKNAGLPADDRELETAKLALRNLPDEEEIRSAWDRWQN